MNYVESVEEKRKTRPTHMHDKIKYWLASLRRGTREFQCPFGLHRIPCLTPLARKYRLQVRMANYSQ